VSVDGWGGISVSGWIAAARGAASCGRSCRGGCRRARRQRETHRYLAERLTDLPGLLAIEGRVFDGRPNQQPWWRQLRTAIALVDLVRHGLEAPVERPGLSDRRSLLARLLRGEDAGSAAALGAAFEYFAPGWVPAPRRRRREQTGQLTSVSVEFEGSRLAVDEALLAAAVARVAAVPDVGRVDIMIASDLEESVRRRLDPEQARLFSAQRVSGAVGAKTMPNPDGCEVVVQAQLLVPGVVSRAEMDLHRLFEHEAGTCRCIDAVRRSTGCRRLTAETSLRPTISGKPMF
jgi:hypothetical protein